MNLYETAQMLAKVQAYDSRTVGEADVAAWRELLVDASLADCMEAVSRYFAEHTDRLMPAHVLRLVREIERQRAAAARDTGWAPGQAGVPRDQAMPEITGRVDEAKLTRSVRELLESVGVSLPEGSREALMPRTVAWEREQRAFQRAQGGEPNPDYRPRGREGVGGVRLTTCGCGPEHVPGCLTMPPS